MPLVQCKLGAAQPAIAGVTYDFNRDRAGRYVALVDDKDHLKCLLAVEHYIVVAPLTDPAPPVVADDPEPSRLGANIHGLGPDTDNGPNPDYVPPAAEFLGIDQDLPAQDWPEPEGTTSAEGEIGISPPALPFNDELLRIKGIGPAMKKKLAEVGITSLLDIAAFTEPRIKELDHALTLKGCIERDEWVEQAKAMLPTALAVQGDAPSEGDNPQE